MLPRRGSVQIDMTPWKWKEYSDKTETGERKNTERALKGTRSGLKIQMQMRVLKSELNKSVPSTKTKIPEV